MMRSGGAGDASRLGNTVQAPLKVFLKLTWLDPASKEDAPKKRVFPKDLQLLVTWLEGEPERVAVGDDGLLKFEMGATQARARRSFVLTFVFRGGAKRFILCEKENDPEEVKFGELPTADEHGVVAKRAFALPQRFNTRAADWKADEAHPDKGRFSAATGAFSLLPDNKPTDLGTADKPLEVTLDPHWQYLRVEFFDRYYGHTGHAHKPVTAPALMFEGHRYARLRPKDDHKPETQSNWTLKKGDHEALVQCVPWILRKSLEIGHEDDEEKKPDRESLLLFRTKAKTFVKSASATARALSVETGDLALDANRLKLYDLPTLWMSRNQFAWLSDSDPERGWFQDLADKETTLDKPLCVSLDDIVLTHVHGGRQEPANVTATQLPLLFFHTFKQPIGGAGGRGAVSYSREGIYKPGRTSRGGEALSKQAAEGATSGALRLEKRRVAEDGKRLAARGSRVGEQADQAEHARRKEILAEGTRREDELLRASPEPSVAEAGLDAVNSFQIRAVYPFSDIVRPMYLPLWHVVDYPHWTRVVVCAGDLYDVFDQRTHQDVSVDDDPGLVVGARAAVRWYDRAGWVEPGGKVGEKPGLVRHPHDAGAPSFALQPLYFQEYLNRYGVFGDGVGFFGRNDLALLRACDHLDDAEVAVAFQYVKLHFKKSSWKVGDIHPYQNRFVQNVVERHHGDDGLGFSVRPEFRSQDLALPIRALYTMFVQATEWPRAHYEVTVGEVNRASANSGTGTAALGPKHDAVNGEDGVFTGAHEVGHIISLPDDYGENASFGSFGHLDFTENVPGLPYNLDERSMMTSNREPRARHYWFVAEWARESMKVAQHQGGVPLAVWHGAPYPEFSLPRHAQRPARSYAHHPLAKAQINGPNGRACSGYLYRFGKDKTSEAELPAYFGGGPLDGAVVFPVRIVVRFCDEVKGALVPIEKPGESLWVLDNVLPLLSSALESDFNKRWIATGDFTTAEQEALTFTRCMVHLQPRLLIENYVRPDIAQEYTGVRSRQEYDELVVDVRQRMPEHHTLALVVRAEPNQQSTFPPGGPHKLFFDFPPKEEEVRRDFSAFLQAAFGFTTCPPPLGEVQALVRELFPAALVAPK
jgi:hypothetical protein